MAPPWRGAGPSAVELSTSTYTTDFEGVEAAGYEVTSEPVHEVACNATVSPKQ